MDTKNQIIELLEIGLQKYIGSLVSSRTLETIERNIIQLLQTTDLPDKRFVLSFDYFKNCLIVDFDDKNFGSITLFERRI